jgi:hypothetical protein
VIVDSQTVRTGKMGGIRGYDGDSTSKVASDTQPWIPSACQWPSPSRQPTFMISMVERNRQLYR